MSCVLDKCLMALYFSNLFKSLKLNSLKMFEELPWHLFVFLVRVLPRACSTTRSMKSVTFGADEARRGCSLTFVQPQKVDCTTR